MKTLVTYIAILFFTLQISAQWSTATFVNNQIFQESDGGFIQCSDGGGGSFIYSNKRVKHITNAGYLDWGTDGVLVSNTCSGDISMIKDYTGGVILTWSAYVAGQGTNIFAQRINSSGTIMWETEGIPVCASLMNQYTPKIASLGSGGVMITWADNRYSIDDSSSNSAPDIYVQRINFDGSIPFLPNGFIVCNAVGKQIKPEIVTSGGGRVVITWLDYRTDVTFTAGIVYAQNVTVSGGLNWIANGVQLFTDATYIFSPQIISDGSLGAIIIWINGLQTQLAGRKIFAQRISDSGNILWGSSGINLSPNYDSLNPVLTTNGNSGAIIAWEDNRSYSVSGTDIYAQNIDSSGIKQWGINGINVAEIPDDQTQPTITSNNNGGAIVAWTDYSGTINQDIYAQNIDGNGANQWTFGGVPVCTNVVTQYSPNIISDNNGGAIVAWNDYRLGLLYSSIYAQKINSLGTLVVKNDSLVNQQFYIYPNPSTNGEFSIQSKTVIQSITAFDILGKEINIEKSNNSYIINASTGIYTLKIIDIEGNSQNKKLIVK